jgi:hypothetical protein
LEKGKLYRAIEYMDNVNSSDPEDYMISERKVTSDDSLIANMKSAGGYAVTLVPVDE